MSVENSVYESAVRGRQDFRAAFREARKQLKVFQWRPIEDAPEDEKIIIFASPDWVDTAFWVLNEDTQEREWFWSGAQKLHQNHRPLVWMPLPEPPSS